MLADRIEEVIFVGMPGPTHNYGGLSGDNVASSSNQGSVSAPREAALQALTLVRLLRSLGITAAILPPQLRPHLEPLRAYFSGDMDAIIRQAARQKPELLEKCYSSSAMWTANAATVTPTLDTQDHMLHLTTANLHSNFHRRIEAQDTFAVLRSIFASAPQCVIHPPLPAAQGYRDEGAANHMRLSPRHDARGLHVFVYGTDGSASDPATARQTLSASQAVKELHEIGNNAALFIKQHPDAIRQGVFHNDVIAVSNEYVLLVHEHAYANGMADIDRIAQAYHQLHPGNLLTVIAISEQELTLAETVRSYFFNSQIVTTSDGSMAIIAPQEVATLYDGKAARLMERIKADPANPISIVHYADLRQSMRNGGGPACLRLRVPMTQAQIAALRAHVNVIADDALLHALEQLIISHYPETLHPSDLADPALYQRCQAMLGEFSQLMNISLIHL